MNTSKVIEKKVRGGADSAPPPPPPPVWIGLKAEIFAIRYFRDFAIFWHFRENKNREKI